MLAGLLDTDVAWGTDIVSLSSISEEISGWSVSKLFSISFVAFANSSLRASRKSAYLSISHKLGSDGIHWDSNAPGCLLSISLK